MGLIKPLLRQVPFLLIEKSKCGRDIKYIADFVYKDLSSNEIVVIDCKSKITEKNSTFRLKSRLFAEKYGFEIKIIF